MWRGELDAGKEGWIGGGGWQSFYRRYACGDVRYDSLANVLRVPTQGAVSVSEV